jgi:pimeloyl-ACP methyl ester carboxylesterase
MIDVEFITVHNGDIQLRVATKGDGPLMVFVHGWPEGWYSWRHQIEHFAARGFRTAALDVRGYGGSSTPTDIASYTITELASDVAAVISALGGGAAIVVGHDWGAPIAWNTARLHPELVRAVAGMSVPYIPVGPQSTIELFKVLYEGRFFYQLYFQEPGVAEEELGADNGRSLRMIYAGAGAHGGGGFLAGGAPDAKLLDNLEYPETLPAWLTEEDLGVYVESFDRSGWTGPLNRYRAQGLDAEQLGNTPNPELAQPATFIGGEHDEIRNFMAGLDLFDLAPAACNDFRGATVVANAGHWVQQEQPAVVNAALDAFVDGL